MSSAAHVVHFLCIGAHKAGTTWLWSILRTHPHIWTAPLKELHYFDRSLRYLSSSILAADNLFERLLSRAPHNCALRRDCRTQLGRAIRAGDWPAARWYARYYLGARDDEWYLSLFAEGGKRVRGEITPAYSMLDPPDVARVQRVLPDAKIIFLLRNPIERAWSHIRFETMQGRFHGLEDLNRVRELIEHPGVIRRGDYVRTLELWESKFPPAQMFIGFFDELVAQPKHLLDKILAFLGLESGTLHLAHNRRINASGALEMPAEVRVYLAKKYLPDLEKLGQRFGGHAERWRAEALALAG